MVVWTYLGMDVLCGADVGVAILGLGVAILGVANLGVAGLMFSGPSSGLNAMRSPDSCRVSGICVDLRLSLGVYNKLGACGEGAREELVSRLSITYFLYVIASQI